MEERVNKTIMCSVLFLDIVEYPRKSVTEQISLKERFNSYLSAAIRDVPIADRIILDTGEGAAINFLGAVDDALKTALSLRTSLLDEDAGAGSPLLVRMGINLGPVRLVRDINGQPSIVGDGINVAQRVMGFADAAQILASRSYYNAILRLSPQHAGMFHYQGLRTDKHVREHEVFAIVQPVDNGLPQPLDGHDAAQSGNRWMLVARGVFRNAFTQRRTLYAAVLAGTLLLLVVVTVKVNTRSSASLPPAAEVPVHPAAPDITEAVVPPKMPELHAEKKPAKAAKKKSKPAAADQGKSGKQITSVRTLKQSAGAKARAEAIVSIAVTPWGEVYLDGRMKGVSPPLAELHVTPGKHQIEIRNTTFQVYRQTIRVKAGEKIKIKHKFAN